jgi:chemotaxis protein methyltransferase CheR
MSDSTLWTEQAYAALQSALRERSGLIFQPLRRTTVETAANLVMRRIGVDRPMAFVALVRQAGAVFDDLMGEVTVGETYFFREAAHFALLRNTILPLFRARASTGQKFRAWSAGCSTGEEAYSIALALREEAVPGLVVGTDVSRPRLGAARRGEYRQWSFRGVPAPTIDRYFKRVGDAYVLGPSVRRDVEFGYLNLASDAYPSMSSGVWGMDVVFCRNVLIYFDRDTIARVATALIASLSEDGWLLLGATDPLLADIVRCEVVQTAAGLAYRRARGAVTRPVPHLPPPQAPPVVSPSPIPSAPLRPANSVEPDSGITPAIERTAQSPIGDTAMDAYARRDYERVIAIVAPFAAGEQLPTSDLVLQIRALANLGRLDEAGRACAAALDRHRDNAELHYLHAVLIAQAGRFAESARAAKRARYLDSSMIVAHLALATALASAGDRAGALRAFAACERLLSVMPPDAPVPAADGEPAGRLLEMTRVQATLVGREGAV